MTLIKWKIADETPEEWMAIENEDRKIIYVADDDYDAMYYGRNKDSVKYVDRFIKRLERWYV